MKKLTLITLIGSTLSLAAAQPFLFPSNPPPVISLAWTVPPPIQNGNPIASYNLYFGVGSRQYTNKVVGIVTTNMNWNVPTRGDKYYLAVTATDTRGLESPQFSNEINFTATPFPGTPSMTPAVVVVAQTSPSVAGPWKDESELTFNLPSSQSQDYIRLKILPEPLIVATVRTPPLPPGMK